MKRRPIWVNETICNPNVLGINLPLCPFGSEAEEMHLVQMTAMVENVAVRNSATKQTAAVF